MSTYRVEWRCCGSVTETEAWEPDSCPFCTPDQRTPAEAAAPDLLAALQHLTTVLRAAGLGTAHADAAIAKATGGHAMSAAVLALVAQQQTQDEAWAAWLADRPMSWLQGVAVGKKKTLSRYKFYWMASLAPAAHGPTGWPQS